MRMKYVPMLHTCKHLATRRISDSSSKSTILFFFKNPEDCDIVFNMKFEHSVDKSSMLICEEDCHLEKVSASIDLGIGTCASKMSLSE